MSALTALYIILPFPLAFIVHDAEETITQHKWMIRHKESLLERFPKAKAMILTLSSLSTKGFAIAAFEELLVLLLATSYILIGGTFAVEIWSALFVAFSLHLLVHIGQSIIIRGYVPGLVTSILLLPYSCLGMQSIWNYMSYAEIILCGITGIIFMVANLRFAHWLGLKTDRG